MIVSQYTPYLQRYIFIPALNHMTALNYYLLQYKVIFFKTLPFALMLYDKGEADLIKKGGKLRRGG